MRAMQIRLTKAWRELDAENVRALPGQIGVFELANEAGEVVLIGMAGGREFFGLRSALERQLAAKPAGAAKFRYEVNMQYQTRYRELLMAHVADHGALPAANNPDEARSLGRIG